MSAAVFCCSISVAGLGRPVEPKANAPEVDRLIEANRLVDAALAAYAAKDFARAAELYARAYESGATVPMVSYNAACCFARLGRIDLAYEQLERAADRGWRDVEHLIGDADLAPLHGDAHWEGLVGRCAANREVFRGSMADPDLYDELMKRIEADQRARTAESPSGLVLMVVDKLNTAWIEEVIEKRGWPGHAMVGRDGAQAAWLLVQHAPDPAFQRRCLGLLTEAYEKGDASADQIAYLTDRVLVGEGKPQLYGTQFRTVRGRLEPYPIENAPEVDQRRANMGLGPLATYAQELRSHAD